MDVSAVRLVYFSPTRTTQRVLASIAQGIGVDAVRHLDLTPPDTRGKTCEVDGAEIALIGAPVYGGRIPAEAAARLRQVRGNGTPAVVVVVYGNRAYEDALRELRDLAGCRRGSETRFLGREMPVFVAKLPCLTPKNRVSGVFGVLSDRLLAVESGFRPIAGGAFIGEHSYSSAAQPIAAGRPDAADLEKAIAFGQQVQEKLAQFPIDNLPALHVPGNFPYKERRPAADDPPAPTTIADLCTLCGDCAEVCPTAAITAGDSVITDARACILCCACTRACPTGARVMEDPRIRQTATWLYENHSARKEPEVFLGNER